jgi:poly-gamma-glutamate synthesis protein (capsule biosynthesis protein)
LLTIADNSDIVFCNLECPLTKNIEFVKSNSFIGPSNAAKLLKNSKINIVSIANNHILDYGIEIYQETLQILKENNIKWIGEYENGLSNIVIFNQNGIKIAFAEFNEVDLHKINNPNLFAELNEKNVELTLKKMNGFGVNFKVVSFHWGDEYITVPSSHQIELGHFAIDRGANIVVGHHPHVVQPIECYKNGLIMYSLGNCIFDFLQSKQFREGIIV